MALRYAACAALLLAAETARACATCSGPADAPQTLGMNAAIFTLFGVLCVVGLTVAIFVALIARRIARHGALPPRSTMHPGHALAIPES